MNYEKEFEDYWSTRGGGSETVKRIAYDGWLNGRQSNPEPQKEKIELVGGKFYVTGDNVVLYCNNVSKQYGLSGHQRKTKADAEKAALAMRKRDRLAAFVYEHCGGEGEWSVDSRWSLRMSSIGVVVIWDDYTPDLCKQYMPYDTAVWLCEKLNSGEIEL